MSDLYERSSLGSEQGISKAAQEFDPAIREAGYEVARRFFARLARLDKTRAEHHSMVRMKYRLGANDGA